MTASTLRLLVLAFLALGVESFSNDRTTVALRPLLHVQLPLSSPKSLKDRNLGQDITTAVHMSTGDKIEPGSTIDPADRSPSSWLAPLWTILAASVGLAPLTQPLVASTVGGMQPLQAALAVLMLSMGLAITPEEFKAAMKQPRVVLLNGICCFGLMPLLAVLLAHLLHLSSPLTVGTVLLGSVSGGQASNLFALLAGGDVALSVVCTLSTTLVGVLATPFLVKLLLGYAVPVHASAVLQSVATLVFLPLAGGLALGKYAPQRFLLRVRRHCPRIGLIATMVLIAGGAANTAISLVAGPFRDLAATITVSILLPLMGGFLALLIAYSQNLNEASKRTLVMEVLSKSPTLAHVLALQHFGRASASIPAASMVSLAIVGATVAAVWQFASPYTISE